MPVFAQVALKGKTAVFDQEIYGYPGACEGLGFGNGYYDILGDEGVEFMSAFFVKGRKQQEAGSLLRDYKAYPRARAGKVPSL